MYPFSIDYTDMRLAILRAHLPHSSVSLSIAQSSLPHAFVLPAVQRISFNLKLCFTKFKAATALEPTIKRTSATKLKLCLFADIVKR